MAPSRIALVDDHPLFRNALAEILRTGKDADCIEIFETASLDEMLPRLEEGVETDLLMLDLGLPGLNGLLGLLSVRCAHPMIPVAVVSARTEPSVVGRCLMLGAAAFIPKSTSGPQIKEAVRTVLEGGRWIPEDADPDHVGGDAQRRLLASLSTLSPRELQICMALARGLLNKQIAHELDIAEATVKAHVSRILEKLTASSRLHAVVLLQQLDGPMSSPRSTLEGAR